MIFTVKWKNKHLEVCINISCRSTTGPRARMLSQALPQKKPHWRIPIHCKIELANLGEGFITININDLLAKSINQSVMRVSIIEP